MNFIKVQKKNRKAISPVLATVILIAITLIAAVAIAGFVFGLFGSFTNSPQLSVSNASCYLQAVGHDECALLLQNTGSGNAGIPAGSCSVNVGGTSTAGVLYAATGAGGGSITVVAGNAAPITYYCYTSGTPAGTSGSTPTGNIITNSGAIAFSGTWK